jgi:hypothetical protein
MLDVKNISLKPVNTAGKNSASYRGKHEVFVLAGFVANLVLPCLTEPEKSKALEKKGNVPSVTESTLEQKKTPLPGARQLVLMNVG